MYKKIIPILTAFAVIPSAVCFTAHADDIINTRYHDTSPVRSGHHGGGGDGTSFADKLRYYMQSVSDYLLNGVYSAGDAVVGFAKDYADSDTTSFDFYNALNAQRLIDLADYANRSTTPPSDWTSYCFTARRRIVYPSGLSEVDTLYYWEDSSTALHPQTQLQGVAIGDFVMQPNTVFVIRNFSDGTSDVFYTNTSEFNVNEYGIGSATPPFSFSLRPNQAITVYDSEGAAETATLGQLQYDSNVFFANNPKNSDGKEINSITTERLLLLNSQNPKKYEQYVGERLSNLSCLLGNVINSSGSAYTNNSSYVLTSPNMSLNVWYISSGGTVARPSAPYSTTFNTDPNTIDPSRPPWLMQPDDKYYTPITQQNITNYNDYGITYNNTTSTFDVDLTALAGAVGAQLQPTFDGTFDGTFNAQPNVGLDYSQPLDLNLGDTMTDIDLSLGDIYNQLLPQPPWVAPTFPALETDPIVSYTYPTLPTNTVPQSVLDDVGTVSRIGFDVFGTLGDSIIGILVALAVLGAVSYFIWG